MYLRLSLLLLYFPARCCRITPYKIKAYSPTGVTAVNAAVPPTSSLDHNDVSPPTPHSVVGLVH